MYIRDISVELASYDRNFAGYLFLSSQLLLIPVSLTETVSKGIELHTWA